MNCPSCGEPAVAGATFCEACGAELVPGSTCVSCGAPAEVIDEHGYCGRCGHKQPAPRDHMRTDLGPVAAVSDRGQRHHRNEDSYAVAVVGGTSGDTAVLVVCDGVSTTDDSDAASQLAADAACAVLVRAVEAGGDRSQAMIDAAAAAQQAVLTVPRGGPEGNPSCTFVAAVAPLAAGPGAQATVGWLGDSRAYWLGPGATRISNDHSWAGELIASGLDPAEAHAHPRAHSITRWLGADAHDVVPSIVTLDLPEPGLLLVCSDGLWNHAETVESIVARPELGAGSPIAVAAGLVDFANASGGHDNITVTLAAIGERDTAADPAGEEHA